MKITRQQLRQIIKEEIDFDLARLPEDVSAEADVVHGSPKRTFDPQTTSGDAKVSSKVQKLVDFIGEDQWDAFMDGLTPEEIIELVEEGHISIDLIDDAIKEFEDLKKKFTIAKGGS